MFFLDFQSFLSLCVSSEGKSIILLETLKRIYYGRIDGEGMIRWLCWFNDLKSSALIMYLLRNILKIFGIDISDHFVIDIRHEPMPPPPKQCVATKWFV